MYLMYGDEILADEKRGQNFFIYGAAFVDAAQVRPLHEKIEALRREYGYAAGHSLKFTSKGRPDNVGPEEHKRIKSAVFDLAREHGVTLCAYLVLNAIAKATGSERVVHWGCNAVLGRYNQFLADRNDCGIAALDRFSIKQDAAFDYAKVKFQRGLTFGRQPDVRLDRVLGLGFTCDGATHMSSVADVLLGALGYCVSDGINGEAARDVPVARARDVEAAGQRADNGSRLGVRALPEDP